MILLITHRRHTYPVGWLNCPRDLRPAYLGDVTLVFGHPAAVGHLAGFSLYGRTSGVVGDTHSDRPLRYRRASRVRAMRRTSGSALLRFTLDAHPDLACSPETNLAALCTQPATVWFSRIGLLADLLGLAAWPAAAGDAAVGQPLFTDPPERRAAARRRVPVNQDTHDGGPEQNRGAPATRRKFLHQIGMTAAATAAVAGLADVAGMKPAYAATKGTPKKTGVRAVSTLPPEAQKKIHEIRSARPDVAVFYSCELTPNHCGAGGCHPAGVWCHFCCYVSSYCGNFATIFNCRYRCDGGEYDFCSYVD